VLRKHIREKVTTSMVVVGTSSSSQGAVKRVVRSEVVSRRSTTRRPDLRPKAQRWSRASRVSVSISSMTFVPAAMYSDGVLDADVDDCPPEHLAPPPDPQGVDTKRAPNDRALVQRLAAERPRVRRRHKTQSDLSLGAHWEGALTAALTLARRRSTAERAYASRSCGMGGRRLLGQNKTVPACAS
jgi:hypothetical protein